GRSCGVVGRSAGRGIWPVFMGEYRHTLDEKGRIIVPAKFRDNLGERCVITRGLDQCLFLYPESEWKNVEEKLKRLPLTQRDARAFTRFFFSGATDVEIDRQGRIMIPAGLRSEERRVGKDFAYCCGPCGYMYR